ncbi:MAG: ThuA domain-containing protein [Candidatus Latescibacteria bacterium]|nr:ThuA domain-containing protein [Candidatus Latescibacterota bacterium]
MKKTTRRTVLKTGITALTAAASATNVLAIPRLPGETRVLLLLGDYWHNGVAQESHWRRVLGPTGFRLMFAQSSQFVTPEALALADLFIVERYAGPDSLGYVPQGIIEDRPNGAPWMTAEQEDAIVANVRRGMGLISMHCSIWNPESKKYMELLGVEKPIMHGPVQHVRIHDINQSHPITKGVGDFDIVLDENFGAVLFPGKQTLLYKSTGQQDNRTDNAAWCREEGEGRVVALLFGHLPQPFQTKAAKQFMWRSAHWAMKRDIPPENLENGY